MNSSPGTSAAARPSQAPGILPGGLVSGQAGNGRMPASGRGTAGEGDFRLPSMGVLGLTPVEEEVYAVVLGLPEVGIGDIAQACAGMGRAQMRAALESLAGRGLVTRLPGGPCRYAAVPPQAVLGGELMRREEELLRARAVVAELAARYRAVPRHSGADELVEVITSGWEAARRREALGEAKDQVRVLARPPAGDPGLSPDPAEVAALERGVAMKVVYDSSAVASAGGLEGVRAGITAGEQARVMGQVPLSMWLVDDRLGLLAACPRQPEAGGLLVTYPSALLDALSVVFEKTWSEAVPVTLGAATQGEDAAAPFGDATTRAVFGLLAAGLTDQAIARRLGCCERTVQRHVQKITGAVGATSRFQAALQIGRRHWSA